MPDAIVTRILGLAGYEVYARAMDENARPLTLRVRQAAKEP